MKSRSRPPTPSRGPWRKADSWADVGPNTPFNKGQLRHSVDSRGPVKKGGSGGTGGPMSFHLPLNGTKCFDDKRGLESPHSSGGVNVKVLIRVRPPSANELADEDAIGSVTITSGQTIDLKAEGKAEPFRFTFDNVYDESTTQEMVFAGAGVPLVENCLNGFNSTIFCYGQTGAGKTHTMIGELEDRDLRGLAPRVFEKLFEKIYETTEKESRTSFEVDCSFLEIHNETITDLLNPSMTNMLIREGATGAYVDGLRAVKTMNGAEALELMRRGTQNRKVSETKANKKSSRSHMVYTCFVEKTSKTETGLERKTYSRLNLVDLAGSERNRASGAKSDTLREACHINKSLSTLGRVIRELVENQRSGHGHIPYRDSKLTYLLQDSLGGNAKTSIIANISPMSPNAQETLSTLQFAKRAKNIRQKCRLNEVTSAGNEMLQKEIKRLKIELENIKMQSAEPNEETDNLKEKLRAEVMKIEDLQERMEATVTLNQNLNEQAFHLQQEIRDLKDDKKALRESLDSLLEQCDEVSARCGDVDALKEKASSTEMNAVLQDLESQKEMTRQEELAKKQKAAEIEDLQMQLAHKNRELGMLREREQVLLTDLETSQSDILKLQDEISTLTEELAETRTSNDELQAREAHLTEELANTKECLETCEEDLKEKQSALEAAETQATLNNQENAKLKENLTSCQKNLQDAEKARDAAERRLEKGEARIEELRLQLGAQHTELKGSQEAVMKVEQGVLNKDREVNELKLELSKIRQELEDRNEECEKLKVENIKLETENADFMEQTSEQDKLVVELQKALEEAHCTSQEMVDKQDMEIDQLRRRYHEVLERASDAEDRLQQISTELERLFTFNFQYTNYFDTIESLLDDFENDCPEFVAKKLEEYEKEGERGMRSSKKRMSGKKSSKRSDRSYRPITPPAAAMRYGVLGQLPGGFAAYASMPSQNRSTMHCRNGSMSAREVWTTGYL